GSAYYAPSAAATEMVEAIIKDKKKILPCAAYLEGEYGVKGLFVGVPVKLGARGIEQIIEIKLTPEEQAALQKSAAAVKELVGVIGVWDRLRTVAEDVTADMAWVAGMDGCRTGWFVVLVNLSLGCSKHQRVDRFLDVLGLPERPVRIAVDMP